LSPSTADLSLLSFSESAAFRIAAAMAEVTELTQREREREGETYYLETKSAYRRERLSVYMGANVACGENDCDFGGGVRK
jgi:hypothetical protein